eukprot:6871909-Prymnesium_polylepis.1
MPRPSPSRHVARRRGCGIRRRRCGARPGAAVVARGARDESAAHAYTHVTAMTSESGPADCCALWAETGAWALRRCNAPCRA